ncbi:hypothetical protein N0V88_006914 [Collariella sp. IMI 366227]|nr:hypothetical protein N0V88_006914 [Collariella sp. IMI 366227]
MAKSLLLKEEGNRRFQAGDYVKAEALYSQAIITDPQNPTLYTNRAMARLKLSLFDSAIADCATCLSLAPDSMKAHYSLSQAHLGLHAYDDALEHAVLAHSLCARAHDKSLETLTAHVLRCRKARWDDRERRRTKTGKSYERASIVEHLRRTPQDPITREPLYISELRPNLDLKHACEEFLQENGWAADW